MKIVTAAEMREIDRLTTEKYGVTSLTLMENAGSAVAEFAQKHFDFGSVCVVCGKGNNGGDGFVAARKLHEAGKKVSLIILARAAEELRGDAAEMFRKLSLTPLWIADNKDFERAEVQSALRAELIVDAILGTGFKPPIIGMAARAVAEINECEGWVLAIDLPSGVDSDSVEPPLSPAGDHAWADGVISFTALKPALVFDHISDGPIAVAAIGSPNSLVASHSSLREDVLTSADFGLFGGPRKSDANKGNFGHVLIVGGSVGKSGAAAMAGLAALRTGAGLVTVACPKSVQPVIAAYAPELMTFPLEETKRGTISMLALANRAEWLEGKSVVVVGPGISRNDETAEFVRDLISICPEWMVIDADGLNAFTGRITELQPDKDVNPLAIRVLTPHPGEMSRLAGIPTAQVQENRVSTAVRVARETQCCTVLKGHRTLIAGPQEYVWINTTGNPGMAKGGSGDVLSGIVAGMLAQWPGQLGILRTDGAAESDRVAHVFSKNDPEAKELKGLINKRDQLADEQARLEVNEKIKAKTTQAVTLLNCLAVSQAVYLHGLAGDIARPLYGERSMLATEIIQCIGDAYALMEAETHSKFAYIQR
jgi:ADP-dependent NAD(P)H-hydrate dehydratase / NAD(P)H-hydrate epimerase